MSEVRIVFSNIFHISLFNDKNQAYEYKNFYRYVSIQHLCAN